MPGFNLLTAPQVCLEAQGGCGLMLPDWGGHHSVSVYPGPGVSWLKAPEAGFPPAAQRKLSTGSSAPLQLSVTEMISAASRPPVYCSEHQAAYSCHNKMINSAFCMK